MEDHIGMVKMKRFIHFVIFIIIISMTACTGDFFVIEPTPIVLLDATELAERMTETNIEIDGISKDWEDRTLYISDDSDDSLSGYLDLTNGYAFVNQDALYFIVEAKDPDKSFSQIDINISADEDNYKIFWKPGNFGSYIGINEQEYIKFEPTIYSSIAYVQVLEGRIDLRDLDMPEKISLESIEVMAGDCCSGGEIKVADSWKNFTTIVLNERDAKNVAGQYRPASLISTPTTAVFTERKPHYKMANGANAEYLYRGDIQTPIDALIGPDGNFYVADEAGRRILKITPAGSIEEMGLWQYGLFETAGPRYLAFNSRKELFFTVEKNIFKVGESGVPERIKISGEDAEIGGITFDDQDRLFYILQDTAGTLMQWESDNISKRIANGLTNTAGDMIFGEDDQIYIAIDGLNKVVKVDATTGLMQDFFKNDLKTGPIFLAIDKYGYIWVRGDDSLYQVNSNGLAQTYLLSGYEQSGLIRQANDYLFKLSTAAGIDFDAKGRMWIASFDGRVVRFESPEFSDLEQGYQFEFNAPEGLTSSGMDVKQDGTVVAFNSLTKELWQIGNETTTLLLESLDQDIVPLAVGDDDVVYVSAKSQVFSLDKYGNLNFYNLIKTEHMVMGEDGDLYASVGKPKSNKIIYQLTERDGFRIFISEIAGDKLGMGNIGTATNDFEVLLADTKGGFYVFDESYSRLYFVDYEGRGKIVTDIPVVSEGLDALAASPDGDVYIIYHNTHEVYHIDPLTGEMALFASDLIGDPILMVCSPDGKWLYVAENGAIDKLPLVSQQ